MSVKKVFGIISYFPSNDSAYHIETRRERSRRFRELLFKLEELWPDVDIMVIAQNWQDFELPDIKNKIITYSYGRLGILGARKELRKRFLESDYDYLIMLDDDGMISSNNPQAYMDEIDKHPDGMGVIRHKNGPLMLLAISKYMYFRVDMPDVDPEKGEGFEDDTFVATCFAQYPDHCFDFPDNILEEKSFRYAGPGKCPSTWSQEHAQELREMSMLTRTKIGMIEQEAKAIRPCKKVFGVISYLPDAINDRYTVMLRERRRRCDEMLSKLNEYWPDIDVMFVAQNWKDYQPIEVQNKVTVFHYTEKLGIIGARKELRKKFLESDYDYMIMIDDDAIISTEAPDAYISLIDTHPDGFGAVHGYEHGPMNFLAISKFVYSQVEVPDVNPENGEGFEDDIFFASCISKFPEKQFKVPDGLIIERSLHYQGPGECPSTWSEERKYNWEGMRAFTDAKLYDIEHPIVNEYPTSVENPTIDLIITYVNSSDNAWIRDFIRATKTHIPPAARFRSWGTLKYLMRGVAAYMPFVRKIILVVSRESQVPVWVNTSNVRVVYHDEFIPKKLLPTFNSCTIESFFWNIPDLADKIIYLNDDVFPTAMMQESDFFTENTPHIKFTQPEGYFIRNIFKCQCRSGIDLITKVLKLPALESGKVFKPAHISGAFTKETFNKVAELCGDLLPAMATTLRTYTNVNQYIYSYYNYYTNNYIDSVVSYRYFELCETTIKEISEEISRGTYRMLCLNDSDKVRDYTKVQRQLITCLEQKFPKKCKYEI